MDRYTATDGFSKEMIRAHNIRPPEHRTMNGSKAKRLRRQAEADTVGLPSVNYDWKRDARGKRNIILIDCTRAVYRKLKKAV